MTDFTYNELCVLEESVKRYCEQWVTVPSRLLELHEKLLRMIEREKDG